MFDCLIAVIAIRAGQPLLHADADADFDFIAEHSDLELARA